MTQGLILAKNAATAPSSSNDEDALPRLFARAILWQHVSFVEPVFGDVLSWTLTLRQDTSDGSASDGDGDTGDKSDEGKVSMIEEKQIAFTCQSLAQRDTWLEAMEKVLVPYHRNGAVGSSSLVHKFTTTDIGWQYKLVHRPAYTMAVTGMVADMVLPTPEFLNQLDEYNGMAPLHVSCYVDHSITCYNGQQARGVDPVVVQRSASSVSHSMASTWKPSICTLLRR